MRLLFSDRISFYFKNSLYIYMFNLFIHFWLLLSLRCTDKMNLPHFYKMLTAKVMNFKSFFFLMICHRLLHILLGTVSFYSLVASGGLNVVISIQHVLKLSLTNQIHQGFYICIHLRKKNLSISFFYLCYFLSNTSSSISMGHSSSSPSSVWKLMELFTLVQSMTVCRTCRCITFGSSCV